MTEDKPNSVSGPWWKQAAMLWGEISTWIVVPIVGALVFGKMLDKRFETEPIIFLSLAGLGFLVTCYGIFRIVKNYLKEIKETERKEH